MNKLIPMIVLSCLLPLAVNAGTLTATGDTRPRGKQNSPAGRPRGLAAYRIIEARMGNKVHITATLDN